MQINCIFLAAGLAYASAHLASIRTASSSAPLICDSKEGSPAPDGQQLWRHKWQKTDPFKTGFGATSERHIDPGARTHNNASWLAQVLKDELPNECGG